MTWRERLFPVEEVNKKRHNDYLDYLENENVPGLDVIISSLTDISNSGLYNESRLAFDSVKSKFFHREREYLKKVSESSVYFLAHDNLDYITYLKFIPRKSASLINFLSFKSLFEFLEIIYFMNVKKELDNLDVQNIYFGGLDERLIFGLDSFDEINEWPQPTTEFFQELKKIRWKNKDTNKFANQLGLFKVSMTITALGLPKYALFSSIEKKFIELIAGCAAVNVGRDKISKEDILIGYKTYLKLLKTDVTKYKARTNLEVKKESKNVYLVCDKCNEYYKLQLGESPDDFTDKCECGGELKYYEDIGWLKE